MNAWLGIVGTLLGGLLGGFLTYWICDAQARRDRHWQLTRLTQGKLEELAETLDDYARHCRKVSGSAMLQVQSGADAEIEWGELPVSRLNALINFYAPALIEDRKKLERSTTEHRELLAESIRDVRRTDLEKRELIGKLFAVSNRISGICDLMASRTATIAQEQVRDVITSGRGSSGFSDAFSAFISHLRPSRRR